MGVPVTVAECLAAISVIIPLRRRLAATPPTIITSFFPVNARARSVTSVTIAKAVSWMEYETSEKCAPPVQ